MNKLFPVLLIFLIFAFSCGKKVNTVNNPHFDSNGYCLDSLKEPFIAKVPQDLTFYVESSGSMNGFFRSNQATKFKIQ